MIGENKRSSMWSVESILACLPGISLQISCSVDSRPTESDCNGNLVPNALYRFGTKPIQLAAGSVFDKPYQAVAANLTSPSRTVVSCRAT
jgi:hypothetical protein